MIDITEIIRLKSNYSSCNLSLICQSNGIEQIHFIIHSEVRRSFFFHNLRLFHR